MGQEPKYFQTYQLDILQTYHLQLFSCSEKTLNVLIKNGANVNAKDIDGRTPFHYAVDRGNENIVKLLKAAGAKE